MKKKTSGATSSTIITALRLAKFAPVIYKWLAKSLWVDLKFRMKLMAVKMLNFFKKLLIKKSPIINFLLITGIASFISYHVLGFYNFLRFLCLLAFLWSLSFIFDILKKRKS